MSETRKKQGLDATLRAWPEIEKSSTEWDLRAQLVMERVRSGDRASSSRSISDEDLLAAPVGQLQEDEHNSAFILPEGLAPGHAEGPRNRAEGERMSMPNRERDRRSLRDLAKLAQVGAPPSSRSGVHRSSGAAKEDDSGLIDLAAAAAADPQADVRAKSTPLASAGLFDDVETASARPSAMPAQPVPSLPPPPAAPSTRMLAATALPPTPPSAPLSEPLSTPTAAADASLELQPAASPGKTRAVVGAVVGVLALAAGAVFVMRGSSAPAQTPAPAVARVETPAKIETAPTPAPRAPVAVTAPVETAPAEPARAEIPAASPVAPTVAPAVAGKPKLSGHLAVAAAPAAKPAMKEGPAAPAKEETKAAANEAPPPVGSTGDLGTAMQAAVGPSTNATPAAAATGPQFAAGAVPQKPSQGAVTSAIGAVLPQARACLGADDPISRAAITFASNGSVQSVTVTGGAVGKPAEGCIKTALSSAKVAPFAEPTYSANITVRH